VECDRQETRCDERLAGVAADEAGAAGDKTVSMVAELLAAERI
jgi:hypothetical protein